MRRSTLICVVLLMFGCRRTLTPLPNEDTDTNSSGAAIINLSLAVPEGATSSAMRPARMVDAFGGVSATASGIESLKLRIGNISICQDVVLDGTATVSSDGCVDLYSANTNGFSTLEDQLAAASGATDYVDVLDASSREALEQTVSLTEDNVGAYTYGMLSWDPIVRATATLSSPADPSTPVLYTHPGEASACSVNGNAYDCVVSSTPLTDAPAEEAAFRGGGNVVFKFQEPFEITQDDVIEGTHYALTIAFNPDGLIQGVVTPGATNFPPLADMALEEGAPEGINMGNTISLVGAQMAAVFSSSDDTVMRESYRATITGGDPGELDLRLEFYTLASDADRTIYGVTTATLPTANTVGYLIGWQGIYGVTTNEDLSVNLLNYEGEAQVSNLVRGEVAGDATTAQVLCESLRTSGCEDGELLDVTLNLDALEAL